MLLPAAERVRPVLELSYMRRCEKVKKPKVRTSYSRLAFELVANGTIWRLPAADSNTSVS